MQDVVEILRILKRRATHPLYSYNTGKDDAPVHVKQLDFHRNASRNRWVFGGNRTGKTQCGAMEAVWHALGTHPHRKITGATTGWVVSLSTRVQRDVAQAKILHYLDPALIADIVMQSGRKDNPERGVIDFITVRNKFGTLSTIGFKTCDQGREKFQGTALDWVWFDEEPPQDVYQECLLRTLDRGGCVWGTMTPLKGRTWVFEEIYQRADENDIATFAFSWDDNPWLPAAEISHMQKSLSADVLESRKYGRFMEGTGIVFPEFTPDNIIDPIPIQPDWQLFVSIDPGYSCGTAVVWLALASFGVVYVLADYFVKEQTPEQHAVAIKQRCQSLGFRIDERTGGYHAYIDSAATQQHGTPESVAKQFRENGISLDTNVVKDVNEGLMKMKAHFCNAEGVRRLFVFRNCTNLISELRGYYWGDEGKPTKRNDHCIDALRYFIATNSLELPPPRPPRPVRARNEFRNRLIRERRNT